MNESIKLQLAWKTLNILETLLEIILESYDDQPDPEPMHHFGTTEHHDTEPF